MFRCAMMFVLSTTVQHRFTECWNACKYSWYYQHYTCKA